jgi:hypothetical protein
MFPDNEEHPNIMAVTGLNANQAEWLFEYEEPSPKRLRRESLDHRPRPLPWVEALRDRGGVTAAFEAWKSRRTGHVHD